MVVYIESSASEAPCAVDMIQSRLHINFRLSHAEPMYERAGFDHSSDVVHPDHDSFCIVIQRDIYSVYDTNKEFFLGSFFFGY